VLGEGREARWSQAGINLRLFAASHPSAVAAMVLVYSVTAEHQTRFMSQYPPQSTEMVRRNSQRIPDGWDFETLQQSLQQLAAAPSLGATPLIVLSRGQPSVGELGVTPEKAAELFAAGPSCRQSCPSCPATAPTSPRPTVAT